VEQNGLCAGAGRSVHRAAITYPVGIYYAWIKLVELGRLCSRNALRTGCGDHLIFVSARSRDW